jgi:hypothetical protein
VVAATARSSVDKMLTTIHLHERRPRPNMGCRAIGWMDPTYTISVPIYNLAMSNFTTIVPGTAEEILPFLKMYVCELV